MKKFFKALALVLALALVIGVVPAQATSAKAKAKKTLYVDGAKGKSTDGKLESTIKERVAIYKLAKAKKADKDDHKFSAKLVSGESVTVSKNYVYAAGLGKSIVEIFVDGESVGQTVVTVKKNADASTLTITGIEDGQEVVCGVDTLVTLPRKGADSDERRLFVDGTEVKEEEGTPRVYKLNFKKAGEHKIKFEAFQSAELDAVTTPAKEITVTAVMPQPVSAKQVSASKFAVTFDGSMKDLIDKDQINNQDIYYLIANQPVVTGVIKSVKVTEEDAKVVEIEMYSNFNSDTDYYFAYGKAEPVKFHTAKNDIKYATSMKLIPQTAYYVEAETPVVYKFYNADGVELDITDQSATLDYDSDVAYLVTGTEKIYFFKEGTATIKATIIIGYDDETNTPIKLQDSITVTGVNKTTTQTGKIYSFGTTASAVDVTKENHQIRVGAGNFNLGVRYTLSDGTKQPITSADFDGTNYILRSADETVAMIDGTYKNEVYGVNPGKTVIILCDKDGKDLDAFTIEVLEKNHAAKADITFSKDCLNLATVASPSAAAIADTVDLVIQGYNLDNVKDGGYTYTIKQAENNADAVKVKFNSGNAITGSVAAGSNGKYTLPLVAGNFADTRDKKDAVAQVRFTVTVKDANYNVVAEKTVSLAVSNQNLANNWVLQATENSLDVSVKNWKDTDLTAYKSRVTAISVKTANGYNFFVENQNFTLIDTMSEIPTTGSAGSFANYVIASYPDDYNTVVENASYVDIFGFKDATEDEQAKTGTYKFTGYHASYNSDGKLVRSLMGTQNVLVTKSDVKATVEILKGTVKEFNDRAYDTDIFKVTWEGISTETGRNTGRVVINPIVFSEDSNTGAIYVDKITVTLTIDEAANFTFEQDISVKKLFKDK